MAIYHLHSSIITRSRGRSAVAAAAYIASDALYDKRQNLTHDYSRKSNVYASDILLPDNAPAWAKNTESLWNRAEEFEDNLANLRYRGFADEAKNAKSLAAKLAYINSAQTASTFEGSLPIELSKEICKELVEEFLRERFVSRGLVTQYAIHWEKGNPHFHAMVTRRAIVGNDFSKVKDREIVSREALKETRKLFAEISNKYLDREGFEARIDHRSFKDMGLELEPTHHKGWKASNLELAGEYSRIECENEQIRINNIEILFKDPAQIIKQIALKKTVFTKEDIANEIIKRVGGDHVLFEILQEKVNEVKIPNSISSTSIPANDNKIFYEGIRNIEEQEKYYALLAENASFYAEEILIEEQEAVLIGSNMKDKLVYGSKEAMEQEKIIFDLAAKINAGNSFIIDEAKIEHFGKKKEQESGFKLNNEQKEAIHYLCSGNNIRNLIGRAGTGKTTLLKVVADSYKDAGYKVIGTSFQGKTIELMAKEIGIQTNTLDSYRIAWQKYENLKNKIDNNELTGSALTYAKNTTTRIERQGKILDDKTVVIVDEANMIAKHLWEPLITRIEKSGAKLIIVQDPAQIKAHTSGDIARGLLDRYGSYELNSILRQKISWQRECSSKLNDHNLREGLAPYIDKKSISWHREEIDCYNKIVDDYVSGIQDQTKLGKSHLFMSFLNNKVGSVNVRIHDRLKAAGLLQSHIMIGNREYSVNERIVFTERNENIGNKVRTISDHVEKGVKNGTFGTIIDISEGKGLKKTTFTVKLDDERIVKFNPKEYSHFSYGYGITINKAEGLTCDYSYVLFDQKMNANLTLISMSRHKEDVKGYLLESDFADFKDLVGKIGKSQEKELISDYTITPDIKPYYDKVKQYKQEVVAVSMLLSKEPRTEKEWQKVKDLTIQRNNLAREILKNYQSYALFVNQANIRKDTIEVHAGIKQRLLSDLEIKARITVERYADVATNARCLWNDIKQTHPAKMAKSHAKYDEYNSLREDRDSLASVIAESRKLYGQFFKENNVKWQAIEPQNKAHYDRQLHNAFVSSLTKEEKEAYSTVRSYIEAKNNVISFVAHFKDKNRTNAKIYNFPDKQEYQLYKQEKITRDELALKLVENHNIYEKYWPVLKVNTDTLLEHAINAEERKLEQTKEQDQKLEAEILRRNEILPASNYLSLAKAIASDMFYQKQIEREVSPLLEQVYKDPEVAKENWQKLELKHGFENASIMVKTNPEIVGQIKGSNILGFKDKVREQADMNKFAIHAIFGIYSEAQKANATRQEVEDFSQDQVQKELSKIDTNKSYDQLLGQITRINTKLIPSLENKVTNQVIENASSRMMEYIIDHKINNNQEPALNEIKSFFYRSKFEAIRFKQLQDRISKDQSLQNYFKQMNQVNRQVNIEGKLFAKDFVQNGYKQPLKIDYHSGNITYNFNQYQTEAAKELANNNKELPLLAKIVENSYAENSFTKSGVQDMAVFFTQYKEKFGSMPNEKQQDCMKNIISNQVKPENVSLENNISYLHTKEITEIYNRNLWQSNQDNSSKLDKIDRDRNRDDYLQIEEKSKANAQIEYSLTKFELDKEAKQNQQELEKQLSKESAKEIGER